MEKLFTKIELLIEQHIPDTSKELDCDKTIICQGTQHKRDCIGKTVSITYYANRIKAI